MYIISYVCMHTCTWKWKMQLYTTRAFLVFVNLNPLPFALLLPRTRTTNWPWCRGNVEQAWKNLYLYYLLSVQEVSKPTKIADFDFHDFYSYIPVGIISTYYVCVGVQLGVAQTRVILWSGTCVYMEFRCLHIALLSVLLVGFTTQASFALFAQRLSLMMKLFLAH